MMTKLRQAARTATDQECEHWFRISKGIERVWPGSVFYLVMVGADGLLHLMGKTEGEIDWPSELRNAAAWVARFQREEDAECEASCPCDLRGLCDDCRYPPVGPKGA